MNPDTKHMFSSRTTCSINRIDKKIPSFHSELQGLGIWKQVFFSMTFFTMYNNYFINNYRCKA